MLIPAAIFFTLLARTSVELPILDDYQIILDTTNWIHQHPNLPARLGYLLTTEHNGYKLVFENAVVFTQYLVSGHINLEALLWIGNLFAPLVLLLTFAMVQLRHPAKWLLLVPVAWLVLQLQYASALNFASSSLQHLAAIFFSLLAIFLTQKSGAAASGGSILAFTLAVCASPNGFFAMPVAMLMLLQQRRWLNAGVWLAVTAALLGAYIYHYYPDPNAAQSSHGFPWPNPIYALIFVGASAARYVSVGPGLLLGLVLLGVFCLALWKRYDRQNAAVFYSMLFILINAVAVSAIRADQGLAQSLASRYRLYSNLFLAFSYIFLIERLFAEKKRITRSRSLLVVAAWLFSIAFGSLSDLGGGRFLEGKKQALLFSYRTEWKGEALQASETIPPRDLNPALVRQIKDRVYAVNLRTMQESVKLGVYQPPTDPE